MLIGINRQLLGAPRIIKQVIKGRIRVPSKN